MFHRAHKEIQSASSNRSSTNYQWDKSKRELPNKILLHGQVRKLQTKHNMPLKN